MQEIHSAETLQRDAELIQGWKAALALVPDYPLVPSSNPPIIAVVAGGEPITYNVAVPVLPVSPAGEVTWWSPEAEKKILKTGKPAPQGIITLATNPGETVVFQVNSETTLSESAAALK